MRTLLPIALAGFIVVTPLDSGLSPAVEQQQASVTASTRCPDQPPSAHRLRHTARPQSRRHMAPGQPESVLVCAYSGVNSDTPSSLQRSGTAGREATRRLQRRLNSAQAADDGPYPCPMDDGSSFFSAFNYRQGGAQRVEIDRTGCRFATNGKRTVFTTDKIQRQLSRISEQPGA